MPSKPSGPKGRNAPGRTPWFIIAKRLSIPGRTNDKGEYSGGEKGSPGRNIAKLAELKGGGGGRSLSMPWPVNGFGGPGSLGVSLPSVVEARTIRAGDVRLGINAGLSIPPLPGAGGKNCLGQKLKRNIANDR